MSLVSSHSLDTENSSSRSMNVPISALSENEEQLLPQRFKKMVKKQQPKFHDKLCNNEDSVEHKN